jgi:hypothetical protein
LSVLQLISLHFICPTSSFAGNEMGARRERNPAN